MRTGWHAKLLSVCVVHVSLVAAGCDANATERMQGHWQLVSWSDRWGGAQEPARTGEFIELRLLPGGWPNSIGTANC